MKPSFHRILPQLLLAPALLAQAPAAPVAHGIQTADLDRSVSPCVDVYSFANGGWLKRNSIPGEYSSWGSFNEVHERNINVLHQILEDAAKDAKAPKGSAVRLVGDFYAAGMDEAAIEKAGLAPLKPLLERIGHAEDAAQLAALVGELQMSGCGPLFGVGVGPDDKRSDVNIAQFEQGGLGLPDRDYYTKTDARTLELRGKYLTHVARIFELLGDAPEAAKDHAAEVLAFETRLAKASMTRVERRDPNAVYHRMSADELRRVGAGFAWDAYFKTVGLGNGGDFIVRQPAFFAELGAMAKELPAAQWRSYLRWQLGHGMAAKLGSAFVDANFDFYAKTLQGTQTLMARWKRVESNVDGLLGDDLGQLYVAKAFSPAARAKALEMIKNIRATLGDRIRGLDWMSEATKAAALKKLDALTVKVGYPDKWKDDSAMAIGRDSYAGNFMAVSRFLFQRELGKLGKPVDRGEWDMTPSTVNAYYNPTFNEIVFPAGILQAPFFDAQADDAVNYGAIGRVMGHEMTHGFDDEGRQFDAQGNLKEWWTPEDSKAFDARAELVVKQYEAYEPLPGMHINGHLTLGENIADIGGMKLAFTAFKRSLEGKPHPAPIDGFTAEQRFFIGHAQSRRILIRPEAQQVQLNTDPHSPAQFRVDGPMSDMPEFAEAFGCKEGDPMKRPEAQRPAIW